MSKPLDPRVKEILKKLELDPKECLWLCHNTTWVMYHRFVEIAGARNKISYNISEIETNSKEGIVCLKCTASIGELEKAFVTTYGEASPANNKNAYPYAMAEKRAVDRAILKLLGLHGFIYSEDEFDTTQPKKEKETHSGTDGAFEGLEVDEQSEVEEIATAISKMTPQQGHVAFYGSGFDGDKQTAIWQLLKEWGFNDVRKAISKIQKELTEAK